MKVPASRHLADPAAGRPICNQTVEKCFNGNKQCLFGFIQNYSSRGRLSYEEIKSVFVTLDTNNDRSITHAEFILVLKKVAT